MKYINLICPGTDRTRANVRGRVWSLICFLLLFLSGCAIIRQQLIDKPRMEYRGMEIRSVSPFQLTPVFLFHLHNSNPKGLDVTSVSYNLKINGRKFVKGVSGQTMRLKAVSSGELELPLPFHYLDLHKNNELQDESIYYELSGAISVGPYTLPYHNTGEFRLPKLPRVSLQEIQIRSLASRQADMSFVLELDNPNVYPLHPDTLAYVFRLENAEMGSGAVRLESGIAPQSRARISVPVLVKFEGKDSPVYQMLQSASVRYEISGVMKFRSTDAAMRKIPYQDRGITELTP